MILKWSFFFGAAALAAYFLISAGIPFVPVLAGCGFAALVTWRKTSSQAVQSR